MIYTQFGIPVEIIKVSEEGILTVRSDNPPWVGERFFGELKADYGIAEINEAIKAVEETNHACHHEAMDRHSRKDTP